MPPITVLGFWSGGIQSQSVTSNFGKSLLIACKFPARLAPATVYAGLAMKTFLAGIFSLQHSLRWEFLSTSF